MYICSGDETLIFAQPIYLSEVTSIPGREGSPVRVRVQDGGSASDDVNSVIGGGSGSGVGTGFEPQWRILPSVLHLEILQLLQTSNRDGSEQGGGDGGDGGIDLAAPGIYSVVYLYWPVYVCMHSYNFTLFIYTAYNIHYVLYCSCIYCNTMHHIYYTLVGISVGELREILREVSVRPAEEQGPDEETQWDSYFDQALNDLYNMTLIYFVQIEND